MLSVSVILLMISSTMPKNPSEFPALGTVTPNFARERKAYKRLVYALSSGSHHDRHHPCCCYTSRAVAESLRQESAAMVVSG